jgi:hypothetical protein
MALPVTIPNTFASATASIPLSQLDTNFTTLADAVNGISDGSETLANASVTVITAGTANVTTLNTSGQVVFNDAGADVDFRVEGDTDANLLFVDASADGSGGIQFNGDTAAANALDDYEEGSSAATITTTTGTVTLDSDYDTLYYTKIGNICNVRGNIRVDSVGSPTGDINLNGLPFTSSSDSSKTSAAAIYYQSAAAGIGTVGLIGGIRQSSTYILLRLPNGGTAATGVQASFYIEVNATYEVA